MRGLILAAVAFVVIPMASSDAGLFARWHHRKHHKHGHHHAHCEPCCPPPVKYCKVIVGWKPIYECVPCEPVCPCPPSCCECDDCPCDDGCENGKCVKPEPGPNPPPC